MKGKKETRLLKFTLNSLLNIDSSTNTIRNEIIFRDINEIKTQNEMITIYYSEYTRKSNKKNIKY